MRSPLEGVMRSLLEGVVRSPFEGVQWRGWGLGLFIGSDSVTTPTQDTQPYLCIPTTS